MATLDKTKYTICRAIGGNVTHAVRTTDEQLSRAAVCGKVSRQRHTGTAAWMILTNQVGADVTCKACRNWLNLDDKRK